MAASLYLYCLNDPVNLADHTGERPCYAVDYGRAGHAAWRYINGDAWTRRIYSGPRKVSAFVVAWRNRERQAAAAKAAAAAEAERELNRATEARASGERQAAAALTGSAARHPATQSPRAAGAVSTVATMGLDRGWGRANEGYTSGAVEMFLGGMSVVGTGALLIGAAVGTVVGAPLVAACVVGAGLIAVGGWVAVNGVRGVVSKIFCK